MEKQISFFQTIGLFAALLSIIFYGIFELGVHPHMPLLLSIVFLAVAARGFGFKWNEIEKGLVNGVTVGIKPLFILGLIGIVIGVWMQSGAVPTLLHLGFKWINPEWFTISALFVTVLVSTFTGSSFTTVGTVGVALMGIASGLGVNPGLAAGAIVSGALFGDKMSPLSDTTNFAPGIVGVDLFSHIRHMLWTTIPSFIVTIIFFLIMREGNVGTVEWENLKQAQIILSQHFNLTEVTLLSPLLVMILAFRRFPTIPTLIAGIGSGVILAHLTQANVTVQSWMNVMQKGFVLESGNEIVDGIVTRGGLQSMMGSISLIIIALALGGLIHHLGMLQTLIKGISKMIRRQGDVIASTVAASLGVNLLTGEQYLSILLPGQTFSDMYDKFSLDPKNLSRTLEDAGTLINPLIPWGVSGAFFSEALGVAVLDYLPYAVFLYASPIIAILLGYLNIGIAKKVV
ncbi:Na+/H+ antiporter NhaC [Bacillus solimangrovi]|uniref:Na+/H+ antiporter NhaC n=1 Tax=Bacillus solimangrovi TaxID=1305675 RepID=A0A1E5LFR2_9BACI|nr:Na+/H+ antiporter NhaC [Bacillus solimangrovi]OEH92903.1 Na+/H+ antiporter NhaC [Bacillus solimangrovi]